MIFNTNPESHSPIYVIKAATLANRSSDIEIPVIMAYDNSHYESLVPNTEEDIRKTIELKNVFLQGQYDKTNEDIPVLRKQNDIYKNSYAAALKKQSPIGKASKDTGKHKINKMEEYVYCSKTTMKIKKNNEYKKLKTNNNKVDNKTKNQGKRIASKGEKPVNIQKDNFDKYTSDFEHKNLFSSLPDECGNSQEECLLSLEELKKDRTISQRRRYARLLHLKRKQAQNKEVSEERKTKTKEYMALYRKSESLEQKAMRKRKNTDAMAKKRSEETPEKMKRNTKKKLRDVQQESEVAIYKQVFIK